MLTNTPLETLGPCDGNYATVFRKRTILYLKVLVLRSINHQNEFCYPVVEEASQICGPHRLNSDLVVE